MRALAGVGGLAAVFGFGVSAWHLFKRHQKEPIEILGFRYPSRVSPPSHSHVAMWKAAEVTAGTPFISQDVDVNLDVNTLPLVETRD
jgi:hypothetical protein